MYHFYVGNSRVTEESIFITGEDVNHIKNVLRMKPGERLTLCDGQGKDYICHIAEFMQDMIRTDIEEIKTSDTELPVKLYLFQGLPKKDKMELIIQKAVELGAFQIIPVMTKRVIVKLDDAKKEEKKLERWNAIAESAAKQSKRGIIPKVESVIDYNTALARMKELDTAIMPFEHAEGMSSLKKAIEGMENKKSVGIFIGPEGGFEDAEVEKAFSEGIIPVSLGKRILRTETAGLTALSILMYEIECSGGQK